MPNKNFYYCKGVGCPLRERCARYVEGKTLPEGNWLWQYDCGDIHAPRWIASQRAPNGLNLAARYPQQSLTHQFHGKE